MVLLYILIVFFGVLTVIFLNGQGAYLSTYYRRLTEEERDAFAAEKMCRFLGVMTMGITVGFALIAGRFWFGKEWLISIGTLFVVLSGFFAVTTPKSRFRKR